MNTPNEHSGRDPLEDEWESYMSGYRSIAGDGDWDQGYEGREVHKVRTASKVLKIVGSLSLFGGLVLTVVLWDWRIALIGMFVIFACAVIDLTWFDKK